MAQHFLLSKPAKTLSLARVFQMKDDEAEMAFRRIRWADTNGEPVCPHCGGVDAYDCRRLKGAPRFRCRACGKDFTITSGTLFASPQAAAALLSRGHRDLLQRGQGQVRAGAVPRSGRLLQVRVRAAAQAARGDGRGIEGPHDRRRRQGCRGRWRIFRRLREARQPQREPPRPPPCAATRTASARSWSSFASATAIQLPAVFKQRSASAISFIAPRRQGHASSTPTKPAHGTNCTSASK